MTSRRGCESAITVTAWCPGSAARDGMGLLLISQMSASSEIVSPQHGGTEIIMRFELHEQEEAV